MALECGIVGLPNVGKSTLFNAITSAENAEAANYPFCTIDPNVGVVDVPDPRLDAIAKIVQPKRILPATVSFVDIAGLVSGASKGEGLGNQFLGHIKNCHAIAHVVRCFEDGDIVHVNGSVDPVRDVEVIDTELMLADLTTVTQRAQKLLKMVKSNDADAKKKYELLGRIEKSLEEGVPVRELEFTAEELPLIQDLHFITQKPMIFVANMKEEHIAHGSEKENPHFIALEKLANERGAVIIPICGKIESELVSLEGDERQEFLDDLGVKEAGLDKLIRAAYKSLGLNTYFTAGVQEVRAWTINEGWTAPKAAGVIHGDFERGFICSETYHYDDLIKYGTEAKVKEAGQTRTEGKSYVVKDGDILHFRFNV